MLRWMLHRPTWKKNARQMLFVIKDNVKLTMIQKFTRAMQHRDHSTFPFFEELFSRVNSDATKNLSAILLPFAVYANYEITMEILFKIKKKSEVLFLLRATAITKMTLNCLKRIEFRDRDICVLKYFPVCVVAKPYPSLSFVEILFRSFLTQAFFLLQNAQQDKTNVPMLVDRNFQFS